jgi:4-amino-4-deoxy-L-arabinose transferase-like glycosyltransferase
MLSHDWRHYLRARLPDIAWWSAVTWIVVFWRLGYLSLLDPDEAHYAQLTREMWRARRWLVPLLDGRPYIDKPVFYHWLQGASVRVFGESEWAWRLPSAVAAVALFAIVRWSAGQFFGRKSGNDAALMFATMPLTFALASVGLIDMVFTAFLWAAIACLIVATIQQRPALEAVGWGLLVPAVLTKGPVAIVLIVLFGLGLAARGTTRPIIAQLHWALGPAVVVVLASPWFLYMWRTFPERFVQDYILAGNLWYVTTPTVFSTRHSDVGFYLRTISGALFPWSLITIGRGVDVIRAWRRGTPIVLAEQMLWIWVLLVTAFFTIARFKLDTYVFPIAPAMATLAAHGWDAGTTASLETRATRACTVLAGVVLIGAGGIASVTLLRINLGLTSTALLLPVVLVTGGVWVLDAIRRRGGALPRPAGGLLIVLLSAYAAVVLMGYPALERSRPTAALGRWIRHHTAADATIGLLGLRDWRASLRYYADRHVIVLSEDESLRAFFARWPEAFVVMSRDDYVAHRDRDELRALGGRPAIVGRTGKYIRRQLWGRIVVVTRADVAQVDERWNADADLVGVP